MTPTQGAALMGELIKTVQTNVRVSEKRTNIYFDLIQVFREHGIEGASACIHRDPAFDQAFDDLVERRLI